MEFSESQLAAVTDAVRVGLEELSGKLDAVAVAARAAATGPFVPPALAAAITEAGTRIVEAIGAVRDMVVEALRGAAAPLLMFLDGLDWLEVKATATRVQGVLRVDQLPAGDHWKGYAADRYALAVRSQSEAAGRVGAVADRASGALVACAAAGLAFYVVLGAIVIKLLVAAVAAIAAFGSVVFSWSGVLYVLAEAGISGAAVYGAVTALTALLGVQLLQLAGLVGELSDNGVFHEGHWPSATTGAYADATVTDGDAEWSFER
jgi:hypothetical protein